MRILLVLVPLAAQNSIRGHRAIHGKGIHLRCLIGSLRMRAVCLSHQVSNSQGIGFARFQHLQDIALKEAIALSPPWSRCS